MLHIIDPCGIPLSTAVQSDTSSLPLTGSITATRCELLLRYDRKSIHTVPRKPIISFPLTSEIICCDQHYQTPLSGPEKHLQLAFFDSALSSSNSALTVMNRARAVDLPGKYAFCTFEIKLCFCMKLIILSTIAFSNILAIVAVIAIGL